MGQSLRSAHALSYSLVRVRLSSSDRIVIDGLKGWGDERVLVAKCRRCCYFCVDVTDDLSTTIGLYYRKSRLNNHGKLLISVAKNVLTTDQVDKLRCTKDFSYKNAGFSR